MLVAVDIGNTSVKFGAFHADGRLVASERVESGTGIAGGVMPFSHLAAADEVIVASSAPDQLRHFLALAGRTVRVLGDEVRRAVPSPYERPEELGLDRLAAAFGARAHAGGGAVVVADVGTAITVDALDGEGHFLPVAIAPGPPAAAEGLRVRAPHLPPAPSAPEPIELPATGTRSSLRTGFLLGLAGLVDRLLAQAASLVPPGSAVIVTGGAADGLLPHLRTGHRFDAHVVLRGIAALHAEVPEA